MRLDLALLVPCGLLQISLTTRVFLLSKMQNFPSHTCLYLTKNAFSGSSHWLSWPATVSLFGPLPSSPPSLNFQGPEAKPRVQVALDKAVHTFLRTVWLDCSTMATLSIFDNIPCSPELDFFGA